MRVVYLLCFALLLVAGQILFKYAALRASPDALPWSLINIWLVLALGLYGISYDAVGLAHDLCPTRLRVSICGLGFCHRTVGRRLLIR